MKTVRWLLDYGEVVAVAVIALSLAFILGYAQGDPNSAVNWPEFDCQEDEIMRWQDARHTAECVNAEEYELELHIRAGHVDG